MVDKSELAIATSQTQNSILYKLNNNSIYCLKLLLYLPLSLLVYPVSPNPHPKKNNYHQTSPKILTSLTVTIFQGAIAKSSRQSFFTHFRVLEIIIVNYSPSLSSFFLFSFSSQAMIYTNKNAPILNLTKPHIVKITFS